MSGRTVTFYFEGRPLPGIEGEPIAKALFASGIRTLSFSVKYKRPRGIHCARGRCVACHMSVNGVPGVPTCVTPLEAGMKIEREDYPPFFGPFATILARSIPLPAGFYYRMFTRPPVLQKFFLRSLRRLAGVGRLAPLDAPASLARAAGWTVPTPSDAAVSTASPDTAAAAPSYDVVVVGSGLSGMSAALCSAHHGLRVLLVDEYGFPGGHSFGYQTDGELQSTRDSLAERILRHTAIVYRPGRTAQGFYPPDTLLLGPGGSGGPGGSHRGGPTRAGSGGHGDAPRRGGMSRIQARAFVFATGANDLVPLFENNDLPGIFGERAIRLFLERDNLRPGRRAVVYGVGTPLLTTAALLLHHDIELVALVDPVGSVTPDERQRRALDRARMVTGMAVRRARGKAWLGAVELSPRAAGERLVLECDLLCVALPGQPAFELAYQAGFEFALSDAPFEECRVMRPVNIRRESDDRAVTFLIAGEAAGETDWRQKIESGDQAGREAARALRV